MAEATALARESVARQFFDALYSECDDGWLVISSLGSGFGVIKQALVTQREAGEQPISSTVVTGALTGDDVYYSVALMQAAVPLRRRGGQANALMVPGIWAEVDFGSDGHSSSELLSELDTINVIQDVSKVSTPSMIIRSGGGFHLYWLLDAPVRVDTVEGAAMIRRANRGLARMLLNAGIPRMDPVDDLARVLRPAGTINWKLGPEHPRDVSILSASGPRYPWMHLAPYLWDITEDEPVRSISVPWEGPDDPARLDGMVGDDGCGWLTHCRDEPAAVTYDEWFLMASLLARVEDGREAMHEWSAADTARYDAAATDEKFAEVSVSNMPARCLTVQAKAGSKWCETCQFRGTITSPVELGRRAPVLAPILSADIKDEMLALTTQEADLRNAYRLEAEFGADVFLMGKSWWMWNEKFWEMDDSDILGTKAKYLSRLIREEMVDAPSAMLDALAANAKQAEKTRTMQAAMTSWRWVATRHRAIELNFDRRLTNLRNGILDTRDGSLRPHTREDLMTRIAACEWQGIDAPCPVWEQFLKNSIPMEEGRRCLQQLAGLSISGLTSPRKLPILWGEGFNGKTVIVETLLKLLGGYGAVAPDGFMETKRHGMHPTSVAALHGSRMLSISETDAGSELSMAFLKRLTGEQTLKAHFMHKDEFEYKPEFTIWMDTNHQPRIRDNGEAAWQRLILIPFTEQIKPGDPRHIIRPEADRLLEAEFPGIIAWAVRGLWDLEKYGLLVPEEWEVEKVGWRTDEDYFGRFLEDCFDADGGTKETFATIYLAYVSWATVRAERSPWSEIAVGKALREPQRGLTKTRLGNNQAYLGLKKKSVNFVTP